MRLRRIKRMMDMPGRKMEDQVVYGKSLAFFKRPNGPSRHLQ